MYCCPTPIANVMSSGVIEIDVILGAVTVTEVDPETVPLTVLSAAVIVAVPAATPVTKPLSVGPSLTLALAMVEELQLTRFVMSQVLASLLVPVATSCCVVFTGTVGLAGATAMETGVAHTLAVVTVISVEPEKFPDCALTVVTPVAWPVTTPPVLTVAFPVSAELQVTD